jgi:hypothetical protein
VSDAQPGILDERSETRNPEEKPGFPPARERQLLSRIPFRFIPATRLVICVKVRPDYRQMPDLLAHSSFDPCIHNAGIGEDESHLLAIAPKEQIEVPGDPILIHRGVGAGTVRVDRIGPEIGAWCTIPALSLNEKTPVTVPSPLK